MRSTRDVVNAGQRPETGHYSDPPLLVLASLADRLKRGHAMIEDITCLCGTHLGPGTSAGIRVLRTKLTFESGKSGLRNSANVGWSAFCERLVLTQERPIDQSAGSDKLQSWCVHAPWAIFGLGPVFLLAGAYLIALFMLWSGWKMSLPGADTPFRGPVCGFENIYFQAARLLFFRAPVLIGWAVGVAAARQRFKAVWPSVALVLIAVIAATNQVHASRTEVPRGLGHSSMDIALGTSIASICAELFYALVILTLDVPRYLVWRLQRARSVTQF